MLRIARFVPIAVLCAGLAGCAGSSSCRDSRLGVCPSPRVVQPGEPVPKGGGRYMIGKPYVIGGRLYRPSDNPHYSAVGIASWYGDAFHGRLTANGEVFDSASYSAAHPTLPIPSYVRVTNLANGRAMVVRVNDRGPYHSDRVIDVSSRVADALKFRRNGLARVRVDYVRPARLDGQDDWLAATLTENGRPLRQSAVRQASATGERSSPAVPARAKDIARATAPAPKPQPSPRVPATPVSLAGDSPDVEESPKSDQDAPRRLAVLLGRPINRQPDTRDTLPERLAPLVLTPPRAIGGEATTAAASSEDAPRRLAILLATPIPNRRAPAPVEKTPPSPSGPKLYLQAGSYRDPDNAERLRKRLATHGTVDISQQDARGVTWYRVRVGPIAPSQVSAAMQAAEQAGVVGARIGTF